MDRQWSTLSKEHKQMSEATVKLTMVRDHVATLWLNRPDKHNAFDDGIDSGADLGPVSAWPPTRHCG